MTNAANSEAEISRDAPSIPSGLLARCLVDHFDRIRLIVASHMGAQRSQWLSVDDVVHDVIVESLECGHSFVYESEIGFARWVSTVARRVVSDALRKRRREPRSLSIRTGESSEHVVSPSCIPGQTRTPSSIVNHEEKCRQIQRALASLRATDRALIRMVQLEGRSLGDVGAQFGCSSKTAAKRFARALLRLGNEVRPRAHVNA
jgi:RNA polymerase sigma-70 factor (ECF subfamily)